MKTESLADTFFWAKKFQKKAKCYGEKVLKMFWHSKQNVFSRSVFWKKNSKKNWKFFRPETIFQIFFVFFFPNKKVSWKKTFFECQKTFQNFFLITFYIFLKLFGTKKMSAKLSVFKKGQFFLPQNKDYFADSPSTFNTLLF